MQTDKSLSIILRRGSTTIFAALALLASGCAKQAATLPAILPPVAETVAEPSPEDLAQWHDARTFAVEGQWWSDTAAPWHRLPARAEGKVTPAVWTQQKQPAGIAVRFVTDSPDIFADWDGGAGMAHMPATGVSGLDLYRRNSGGEWEYAAVGKPYEGRTRRKIANKLAIEKTEYLLFLPLYREVTELKLGFAADSTVESAAPLSGKPIVFYGTSITQGGCASRAGMAHTSILRRWLDRPVINLGVSGAGKMEIEMAELLAEIDAELYVIDCLDNMTEENVSERVEPFVEYLRKSRPGVPILLVESPRVERKSAENSALKAAFESLNKSGVEDLTYMPGEDVMPGQEEATVDSVHPTDLGFFRMATAMKPVIESLLK